MSERTADTTHPEFRWTDDALRFFLEQQEQSKGARGHSTESGGFSFDHTPPRHDYWNRKDIKDIRGMNNAQKILTGLVPIGLALGAGGLGLGSLGSAIAGTYLIGGVMQEGFQNLQPHNDL